MHRADFMELHGICKADRRSAEGMTSLALLRPPCPKCVAGRRCRVGAAGCCDGTAQSIGIQSDFDQDRPQAKGRDALFMQSAVSASLGSPVADVDGVVNGEAIGQYTMNARF